MIAEGHKRNFETMKAAFQNGDVALVECMVKDTKEVVVAVCALNRMGDEVELAPLARMFSGNPYDELLPPDPDGGFVGEEP